MVTAATTDRMKLFSPHLYRVGTVPLNHRTYYIVTRVIFIAVFEQKALLEIPYCTDIAQTGKFAQNSVLIT